jgi:hypothetical protein
MVVVGSLALTSSAAIASTPAWSQVDVCYAACTNTPPARQTAAEAYDPATSQVVLFGGASSTNSILNDTWTWNGSTWAQQNPGTAPPARFGASLAYDAATKQLVLFGGYNGGPTPFNDTWVWDGSTWSQVDDSTDPGCTATCTNSPSARYGASLAYDAAPNQLVLFGGYGGPNGPRNDTWVWDGSTWAQQLPQTSPSVRYAAPMAFDSSSHQLVLVGGEDNNDPFLNDTWVWDGSTWSQVDDSTDPGCTATCTNSPSAREQPTLAYDPATSQLVLFGGSPPHVGAFNDTWAWDGSTWAQVADDTDPGCTNACANSPAPRVAATTSYDSATNQVVLFGGYGAGYPDDTWVYAAAMPTPQMSVTASPNPVDSGTSVTYSASVTSPYGGTPSGAVTFSSGATPLCTATLSNGSGSCSSPAATVGTDTIIGTYPGDNVYATSTGITTLTVNSPPPPPPPPRHGYWLVGSDGGIFSFGSAQFYGSTGNLHLQRPVVGIVPTKDRGGYWLDAADGGVFSFGDTQFYGSIPGLGLHPAGSGLPHSLNAPIVGMVPSHDQGGYFMVASDGGVFAFGDAHFAGSCPGIGGCSGATVAVMPDASGNGYWLITKTGHVYTFGDAPYLGAPGPQSSPITSAVATPSGHGYYILDANGQVFAYGDATRRGNTPSGSTGGLNPASAIFTTSDGGGYWVSDALGKVFSFGNAPGDGDMSGTRLNGPVIAARGS